MATPDHILLLAGTFEARQLAELLANSFPELRLTASFAGVVQDIPDLGVQTRIGGFGGADGLADYLSAEKVSLIIDATHPFAAQMSQNAAVASATLGVPLVRLERSAWNATPEDNWIPAVSMDDAAANLPSGARAFLAVGRKEISRFTVRADIYGLVRMIEPPVQPLPSHWDLVLARPPQSPDEEITVFRVHDITHVVTKNSGGTRSFAKIEAARQLQLPVIMIERPTLPSAQTATDIPDLLESLERWFAAKARQG